ncbi:bifunctional bis(5'-adenosyl)-triphosphatase/adenylylsulfatase FHIT [Capsicum galapagoense]
MLKLVCLASCRNLTRSSNLLQLRSNNHIFRFARLSSSSSHSQSKMMEASSYMFGPYKIDKKEVFYSTDLSYALVNLRPLLPGVKYSGLLSLLLMRLATCGLQHKKLASNLSHTTRHLLLHLQSKWVLTVLELCILLAFCCTYFVIICVLTYFFAWKAVRICLFLLISQDGPQAGQTVPHVHIHVIPRKSGDFEKKDEIYDALDLKEKEMKQSLDLDKERKDRRIEEMAEEADEYRKLF